MRVQLQQISDLCNVHLVCSSIYSVPGTEAVKNASLYCYGGPQNKDDYHQSFGFEHVMPRFPNPFTLTLSPPSPNLLVVAWWSLPSPVPRPTGNAQDQLASLE
jgi:hypothetical protein